MSDGYRWLVFVHVASVLVFFLAHGAAAAVVFRLRRERDLARVRALLELSSSSVGATMSAALLVALVTGVWAGFAGNWWGHAWIWVSIGVLVVVAGLMTPLGGLRLKRIRAAAGLARGKAGEIPPADPVELERLLAGYSPIPVAVIGFSGLLILTWLMILKPF
jgi:predicted integral membrane protein DUF2269